MRKTSRRSGAVIPEGIEPPSPGCKPGALPLDHGTKRGGRTSGTRTHKRRTLSPAALPVCVPCDAVAVQSQAPVSSREAGLMRAGWAPATPGEFMTREGVEPSFSGREPGGLPLAERAETMRVRGTESNRHVPSGSVVYGHAGPPMPSRRIKRQTLSAPGGIRTPDLLADNEASTPGCSARAKGNGHSPRGIRTLSISRSERKWSSGCLPGHRSRSSGGWNRTSGLRIQSAASLPAATPPESTSGRRIRTSTILLQRQVACRLADSRVRHARVELACPVWKTGASAARPMTQRTASGRRGSRTLKAHRSPDLESGAVALRLALPTSLREHRGPESNQRTPH